MHTGPYAYIRGGLLFENLRAELRLHILHICNILENGGGNARASETGLRRVRGVSSRTGRKGREDGGTAHISGLPARPKVLGLSLTYSYFIGPAQDYIINYSYLF